MGGRGLRGGLACALSTPRTHARTHAPTHTRTRTHTHTAGGAVSFLRRSAAMEGKGMSEEDIDAVLNKTKLRLFVGVEVAAQIWDLDVEGMGEEAYAAAVVELTRPAREQGSAAGE